MFLISRIWRFLFMLHHCLGPRSPVLILPAWLHLYSCVFLQPHPLCQHGDLVLFPAGPPFPALSPAQSLGGAWLLGGATGPGGAPAMLVGPLLGTAYLKSSTISFGRMVRWRKQKSALSAVKPTGYFFRGKVNFYSSGTGVNNYTPHSPMRRNSYLLNIHRPCLGLLWPCRYFQPALRQWQN